MHGLKKGYYFPEGLSKISLYWNLRPDTFVPCTTWKCKQEQILLANNTVARLVSGVDKRKSKHPTVWREEWVAVIYLLGTEADEKGEGQWMAEGRGEGKHDLAPMVSTGAHAHGSPTSNQSEYTWDTRRGCTGNRSQSVKTAIIPVPSW